MAKDLSLIPVLLTRSNDFAQFSALQAEAKNYSVELELKNASFRVTTSPVYFASLYLRVWTGIIHGRKRVPRWLAILNIRGANGLMDPHAAWSWHLSLAKVFGLERKQGEKAAVQLLSKIQKKMRKETTPLVLLGTGPSAIASLQALNKNSHRFLFCNTAVRSRQLFQEYRPFALVAGDGLYHFGSNNHARSFFRDLRKRLDENKEMLFIFPSIFWPYVFDKLGDFRSQLCPMRTSRFLGMRWAIRNLSLPRRGNVLNLLLLPIGTMVSERLVLAGFDGRKSGDSGFWSNDKALRYESLVEELQRDFPAFFEHNAPVNAPERYSKKNLGATLERDLRYLRKIGVNVSIMGKTSNPGLQLLPEYVEGL